VQQKLNEERKVKEVDNISEKNQQQKKGMTKRKGGGE